MQKFLDSIVIQLRHYREANHFSQSDLATKLNCGLRSYQRYESGESIPPIDFLYQASKVMGFSLSNLMAPSEKLKDDPNFQPYESEQIFLRLPLIQASQLLSLANSEVMAEVMRSGELAQLKTFIAFMKAPYCLGLSTPKQTIFNDAFLEKTGLGQHIVHGHTGYENLGQLGSIWGTLLEKHYQYFIESNPIGFPRGRFLKTTHGIFKNVGRKYYVLAVMDLEKIN